MFITDSMTWEWDLGLEANWPELETLQSMVTGTIGQQQTFIHFSRTCPYLFGTRRRERDLSVPP